MKRHRLIAKPSRAHQDRFLMQAYGATRNEMAESSRVRRLDWMDYSQADPLMLEAAEAQMTEKSPHDHQFRERTTEKELGKPNGHFSARTYVPRVYYSGGGALHHEKTAALHAGPKHERNVDLMDPRASTCSLSAPADKLKPPPYTKGASVYLLRGREPEKELHPPIHFRSKNDLERVNEHLTSNTVNDDGRWDAPPAVPTWRVEQKDKWRGARFKATTHPATNYLADMEHRQYHISILAQEPCVEHPGSVHSLGDRMQQRGFRIREKEKEISSHSFSTLIPRDTYVKKQNSALTYEPYERQYPELPYCKSFGDLL